MSAEIADKLLSLDPDDHAVLILAPFRVAGGVTGVRRFVETMPPRTRDDIEARAVALAAPPADVRGEQWNRMLASRFRAPHNTVSASGLARRSTANPNRTEFDLAKGGVLLLDEVDEFRRDALEDLARRWRNEDDVLVIGVFYVNGKDLPHTAEMRLDRAKQFGEAFDAVVIDVTGVA